MERRQYRATAHPQGRLDGSLVPVQLGIDGIVVVGMGPVVVLSVKERIARSVTAALVVRPGSVQQQDGEGKDIELGTEGNAAVHLTLPEGQQKEDTVFHDGRIALLLGQDVQEEMEVRRPMHGRDNELARDDSRITSL